MNDYEELAAYVTGNYEDEDSEMDRIEADLTGPTSERRLQSHTTQM